MKKLLNDPRHVVREMLEGLTDLHPGLALMAEEDVVVRADLPRWRTGRSPSCPAAGLDTSRRMRAMSAPAC